MTRPTLTVVGKGEPVAVDSEQALSWRGFRDRIDAAIEAGEMPEAFLIAVANGEVECLMTGDATLAWLARRLAENLLDDAAGVA